MTNANTVTRWRYVPIGSRLIVPLLHGVFKRVPLTMHVDLVLHCLAFLVVVGVGRIPTRIAVCYTRTATVLDSVPRLRGSLAGSDLTVGQVLKDVCLTSKVFEQVPMLVSQVLHCLSFLSLRAPCPHVFI